MIDLKNNKVNTIDYNREPLGTSENIRGQELLLADLKSILPTLDRLPPGDPVIADFIKKVDYLRRFAFAQFRPHLDDLLNWTPSPISPLSSNPGSDVKNQTTTPLFSGPSSQAPAPEADNPETISGLFRVQTGFSGSDSDLDGSDSGPVGSDSSPRTDPPQEAPASPDAITLRSEDPNLVLRFLPRVPLDSPEDRAAFQARADSLNDTFNHFDRLRRGRPAPLLDLHPDLQKIVFSLLENHTAEDVASILAIPLPFGLGLKTSKSAVNRFRNEYPRLLAESRQAQESRAAEEILGSENPDAFKTEFQRRVHRRLLTTDLTSNKAAAAANTLINALSKLHRAQPSPVSNP